MRWFTCTDENCDDQTTEIAHDPTPIPNQGSDFATPTGCGDDVGLGEVNTDITSFATFIAWPQTARTMHFDAAAACFGINRHDLDGDTKSSICPSCSWDDWMHNMVNTANGELLWTETAEAIEAATPEGIPGTNGNPTLGHTLDQHVYWDFLQKFKGWENGWVDFPHGSYANWWGAPPAFSFHADGAWFYELEKNGGGGATYTIAVELR